MKILLAIIPENIEEVKREIELVRGSLDWVQIDIMDGVFVPPVTWPYSSGDPKELEAVTAQKPNIELHFMIQDPETVLDKWIGVGARRMLIHAESTANMGMILERLKYAGVQAGIALDLETPVEVIEPYVKEISVVQLMSVGMLGHHGQPFSDAVIEKIETVRRKYPDLIIQVDGGINFETGKRAYGAGARNLVVGGAILKSKDIKETINEFRSIAK
jgi:ribulose-phosphate 3-epimerase